MAKNLHVTGSATSDTLIGGDGNDHINGGGGDDTILGGDGNDRLLGGEGNDVLSAGSGNDHVFGEAGDDRIIVGRGNQRYDGGTGYDTFDAASSTSGLTIDLGAGVVRGLGNSQIAGFEEVIGSGFADWITGSASSDVIRTNGGDDTVHGGAGDDTLHSGAGNDRLFGDAGNDTLVYDVAAGRGFSHVLDGGAGMDTLKLQLTSADLTGAALAEVRAYKDFVANPANDGQTFAFSAIGDLQVTFAEDVRIFVDGVERPLNIAPVIVPAATPAALTVAHNHSVAGTIVAADADGDRLTYSVEDGPAHGTVTFSDAAHYTYSAGDHVGTDSFTLAVSDGQGGVVTHTVTVTTTNDAPVIDAASSTSTLTVIHDSAVTGRIVALDADGDNLGYSVTDPAAKGTVSIDATGVFTYSAANTAGPDSFTVEVSDGHGGVATHTVSLGVLGLHDASAQAAGININLTTDTLNGSPSPALGWIIDVLGTGLNDVIVGDGLDNRLEGGAGRDELRGLAGRDTLIGGDGDDRLFGDDGSDTLIGGAGNDLLNGGAHDDDLRGGPGNDGFFGGGGNDRIWGEDGNDRIFGDGGDDIISGGRGSDTMTGGSATGAGAKGSNTYAWARDDVVGSNGLDHITDFGAGDRLDFSAVLSAAGTQAVHDAVLVTDTAAGTLVSVDVGSGFVGVVVLDGVHGISIDDLDSTASIIV